MALATAPQRGAPTISSGAIPTTRAFATGAAVGNGRKTRRLGDSRRVLVYEFWFCDDPRVEPEQERELRQWGVALSEVADREQRAMGRAILMLLEQVDSLRAELDQAATTPEPDAIEPAPAVDDDVTSEVEADETPLEDTTVAGLRDRLRAVAHRGRN